MADRALDAYDPLAVRGLLHDLGHQMTTLSCLVEAVRGEAGLPGDAQLRIEVLALEMSRLLGIIERELRGAPAAAEIRTIDLRSLAGQVAQFARLANRASVVLLPGPDVALEVDPSLLWRVLTNVVGNAARATGAGGKVEISLRSERGAAIDVIDDGPGFGRGPPGTASLGLSVVTSLLDSCGGWLEVRSPRTGGTQVSIRLPAAGRNVGGKPEGCPS
jgi:signal transduction histidine kinase